MNLQQLKEKLLEDPAFKKAYESEDIPFEFAQVLINFRILKGLSQAQLAVVLGVSKRTITKLEEIVHN